MIHVVKHGETMWELAQAYGTSVSRLRSDNGLLPGQPLLPGQALLVLVPTQTIVARPGDTLFRLAKETGESVLTLLRNNPTLADQEGIAAGQELALGFQPLRTAAMTVNGYAYPFMSRPLLRRVLPFLTNVSVFSCGFQDSGRLLPPEDNWLLQQAKAFGVGPILVLTSIGEDGMFSTERAGKLFRDAVLQNQVLDQLLTVMEEKGYVGMEADFEFIRKEDRDAYLSFLKNAAAKLKAQGFFLSTALAPKTSDTQAGLLYEAHDYGAIGILSQRVLLMTYEWGYAYGPPMAVAPLPNVQQVVSYGETKISPGKILMGMPNYGYDWTLPYRQGRRAETLGNQEAILRALENGAEIQYDTTAQSPYFRYQKAGEAHVVWFEDVRSVQAKLSLAAKEKLFGVGYWNLLRPFTPNWALLNASYCIRESSGV